MKKREGWKAWVGEQGVNFTGMWIKGSIWPESPLESMIRIWEQPQTETYAWPAETEEFIQRSL